MMLIISIFTKSFNMAKLFLVPNVLSDGNWQQVLPVGIYTIITETKYFIVENIRTTRRFMKQVNRDVNIDECTFFELNKHTSDLDIPNYLKP
jgi:16S rRNA (cytidine1402-2'-O)-methyltransferase